MNEGSASPVRSELQLARLSSGDYVGRLNVPEQGADLRVSSIAVNGDVLRFEIKQVGGVFEGTVNAAKTLATGHLDAARAGSAGARRPPPERGRGGRRARAKTSRRARHRSPSADGGAVHHAVHGARARAAERAAQSRRFLPGLRAGAGERRSAGGHRPGAGCDRAAADARAPDGHRARRRAGADRAGHAGQRAHPGRRRRGGVLVAALRQTRRCPAVRRPSSVRQRRRFRRAGDQRSGGGRDRGGSARHRSPAARRALVRRQRSRQHVGASTRLRPHRGNRLAGPAIRDRLHAFRPAGARANRRRNAEPGLPELRPGGRQRRRRARAVGGRQHRRKRSRQDARGADDAGHGRGESGQPGPRRRIHGVLCAPATGQRAREGRRAREARPGAGAGRQQRQLDRSAPALSRLARRHHPRQRRRARPCIANTGGSPRRPARHRPTRRPSWFGASSRCWATS